MAGKLCPIHASRFLHPSTGACTLCGDINNSYGRGRSKKKGHEVFAPGSFPRYGGLSVEGRILDVKDAARWLDKLDNDPVRRAELNLEAARPRGVSRERHGIAARSACRIPMLNANDPFRPQAKPKPPELLSVQKRFRVKPDSVKTALGNWLVRDWTLWNLKYAPGFIIVNDKGQFSGNYKSWHLAKEAIEASGYVIIK